MCLLNVLMEKKKKIKKRCRWPLFAALVISLLFYSDISAEDHIRPSGIIKLPDNENAILVEKKNQTLFLYGSKSGELEIQYQIPCSTGEMSGVKHKAGDRKTPEGIYFLKDEYEDQYLSPIYGAKAFPLDYPNLMDKRAGRDGSAIWIHGTNKVLKPMDSKGCIALENSNILKLAESINLDSTPVILVEELGKTDKETLVKQEQEISRMVDQWLQSVEKGSYHDYLSFYADEYLPEIGWWMKWMEIRSPGSGFKIERDRTGIYYHDHIFVALFDYYLSKNSEKILLGKRKLFKEKKGQAYKIIGETYQNIPKEFQGAETPLLAAALKAVKPVSKPEPVMAEKPQIAAKSPQEARPPRKKSRLPQTGPFRKQSTSG